MKNWIFKDSRKLEHFYHPTTHSILALLQRLYDADILDNTPNILDFGCGSGILALFAADLWPDSYIVACDTSKQAIIDAKENSENNYLAERVLLVRAEGLDHRDIQKHATYHLMMANLLAELHLRYARKMIEVTSEGGYILLSGIQIWKAPQVMEAFSHLPLIKIEEIREGEWVTLLYKKPKK